MIDVFGLQGFIAKNTTKLVAAGAIAVLWVGSCFGAYFYGKAVQRTEYSKQEVKVLTNELKDQTKEAAAFGKRAEKTGGEVATMQAELTIALEKLNAAIEAARRSTACDLTDDELDGLQALRDSYR